MTVQQSKNPQLDMAEDNAFFPSEYSLGQYTSPISDLDGVDYPKPYSGKQKSTVIAADERYLPTDNGKLFSTGNHPIETLLPLYHLHAAGFEFEVATLSGLMTKFEYWAMPRKDEKIMPFFEQHKSLFRNPKNWQMLSPASTQTANMQQSLFWRSRCTHWFTRKQRRGCRSAVGNRK